MTRTLCAAAVVAVGLLPLAIGCTSDAVEHTTHCPAHPPSSAGPPVTVTFPDFLDNPGRSPQTSSSATLRVGQRLTVTVGFPSSTGPTVPAASNGNVLCELDRSIRADATSATFVALHAGQTQVYATLNRGARAYQPELTVQVTVATR